jgi:hypothetical protein
MSFCFEIVGGAGERDTAAILAALTRLDEEQALAWSAPPQRPSPGRWVQSGRPAPVSNPFIHRPAPAGDGWSMGSELPVVEA